MSDFLQTNFDGGETTPVYICYVGTAAHKDISISYRIVHFSTNNMLNNSCNGCVFWRDGFTFWPVVPLLNQPDVSMHTHPIVWGALWGAEVTGWRTWVGRASFLPGTHGISRRAICRVSNEVRGSVSQHKGRALGPGRLSSVQLETLDWSPQKEGLMGEVGKIQMKPSLVWT